MFLRLLVLSEEDTMDPEGASLARLHFSIVDKEAQSISTKGIFSAVGQFWDQA